MYTPSINRIDDRALLIEAMQAYSFGLLVNAEGRAGSTSLLATHLPLVVKDEGAHGVIEGHMARANQHWQGLTSGETLVVFSGPHSYVSPTLYTDPLPVPTWNYIAVHAYGAASLIEDEAGKDAVLTSLMRLHEPLMAERWHAVPAEIRSSLLAGIVAFRMPIARIEGKFKISQNRAPQERQNVQAAHAGGSADEQSLAAWMARLEAGLDK
jgi:transcriptional regulator